MKKIVSLILAVLVVFSMAACSEDLEHNRRESKTRILFTNSITQEEVNSILAYMNNLDTYCETVAQKSQNGADTTYDMVKLIALGLGVDSYMLDNIQVSKDDYNYSIDNAVQKQANSTYRTVELLALIAYEMDKSGEYSSQISAVESRLYSQEDLCTTPTQQVVNGEYRMVEMLELMALIADSKGEYSGQIQAIMDEMKTVDDASTSAPQQSVNGAYRTVDMVLLLAEILDYDQQFDGRGQEIADMLDYQDGLCESTAQQNANGTYRTTEAFGLLAEVLNS